MAYTLGDITLPRPKIFRRRFVETERSNTTATGELKRRITNRKEEFELVYQNIKTESIENILSEYNLQQVRTFTVTETNLTIAATDVHIDIRSRGYNPSQRDYRQDFVLVLREVI